MRKLWDEIKYPLGAFLITVVITTSVSLWYMGTFNPAMLGIKDTKDTDWYLVCSGKDKDYLVKSEGKPYTKDGFIYIDGESFITAEAGMTCKPVKGEVVRAAIGEKSLQQGK